MGTVIIRALTKAEQTHYMIVNPSKTWACSSKVNDGFYIFKVPFKSNAKLRKLKFM
jgi:hypothetical protein